MDGVASIEVSANAGGQNLSVDLSIIDSDGKNISKNIKVSSIDSAKIAVDIPSRENIIAGAGEKDVTVRITDANGKNLDGFNGIASIDFPKNSGKFSSPFVQIQNGVSSQALKFIAGTVAVENGKIDVQVPGIKEVVGGNLTILPDAPMRVGLSADTTTLEARKDAQTRVQAKLYDRYGNLATNHSAGMRASFSIPNGYGKFGSVSAGMDFVRGVASADIRATKNPGTLYYKVSVTPGLETNSFTVSDKSGASLAIK